MNFLFVACLSLFLLSAVADSVFPKFCTGNVTACNLAGINVTCVTSSDCTKEVADGKADLTYAYVNGIIKNEDNLKMVLSQKVKDVPEKFVLYYGLAVVRNETSFNFKQLKGKDSCHTGVGRTVGWNIPVGYLLYTKEMQLHKDQYKSAADFFGKSCAPGADRVNASAEVKNDLCSLCNGTCSFSSSVNPYAGYVGSFKCMANGEDRVGFVKQTTADQYLAKYPGSSRSDYKLLCRDGTTKPLDQYKDCYIASRPASALVTGKDTSPGMIKKYQNMFKKANIEDLRNAGMISSSTERLEEYNGTIYNYMEPYANYYKAVQKTDTGPRFCGSTTKCNSVKDKVHVTCVAASPSSNCVEDVVDGKADFTLANANDMVRNQGKLKIVRSQKLKDLEKNVQYYGVAVVKSGTSFNFTQLKGKDSCHTGVGRTVGWVIPVGYLLDTKEMPLLKDQYKSVADYFKKSCAPGIGKKSNADQAVKDDLCSLCNGAESVKCTSKDPFAGYEGAFKCMAAGNNDRVGFVKQDTADKVISSGLYGSKNDYELLCTNGQSKPLDEYKNCYIGTRPADALVTSKNKSNEMVAKIESTLSRANLADLVKAGMVDENIENLEEYSNTVEKYVEKYAKYRSALDMTNDKDDEENDKDDEKTNAALSVCSPFVLQVVAVFASIVILFEI